jgi:predicted nucleic acid-binding protein
VIAVDTSSLRRYLAGEEGPDVELLQAMLDQRQIALPPVVMTEILSEPRLQQPAIAAISALPLLIVNDGYWSRAGLLRAKIIASGQKAKVADALIAQSCIDHRVPLITADRDFRHFTKHGLSLI